MKSADDQTVLNDQVFPHQLIFFFPGGQDDARIDQPQIVKEWFKGHKTSFSNINWPPQSQPLILIENLCDVLE